MSCVLLRTYSVKLVTNPPRGDTPTTRNKTMNAIDIMDRHFTKYGHDLCEWTRCMIEARSSVIPAVKADRLRAASEFRAMLKPR